MLEETLLDYALTLILATNLLPTPTVSDITRR
jgi:hypothetical protein